MKRIILLLAFVIMLTACTAEAEIAKPDFSVNSDISIKYGDCEYAVRVSSEGTDRMKFEISEPENLKGICLEYGKNGAEISCGDLHFESEKGYYIFTKLYETLNAAESTEPVSKRTSGERNIFGYNGFSIETDVSTNRIKKVVTSDCVYEMR